MKAAGARIGGRLPAAIAAAVLVSAGCSAGVPATPTPRTPSVTADLPADQVVLQVVVAGGYTPPVYHALAAPSIAVFGDGRLVQVVRRERGLGPAAYTIARVPPRAVAQFAADAEASGLIADGTDFGMPGVTDMPSLIVTLRGQHGSSTVSVYAPNPNFEKNLTDAQRANRRALEDLIARANQLPGSATKAAFRPARVLVYGLADATGIQGDAVPWPGPDPDSFMRAASVRMASSCGELTGAPAQAAYAAALANPGVAWRVSGQRRILVVNPLPLDEDCR